MSSRTKHILESNIFICETAGPKDERDPADYKFGPFSIICSIGNIPGQVLQLDVVFSNYQFTLMITNNTPGTTVFKSNNATPVRDITLFVKWIGADPSTKIGKVLSGNQVLCTILENYGEALDGFMKGQLVPDYSQSANLKCGTTRSIPGSIVHTGLSYHEFRAMFLLLIPSTKKKKHICQRFNTLLDRSGSMLCLGYYI